MHAATRGTVLKPTNCEGVKVSSSPQTGRYSKKSPTNQWNAKNIGYRKEEEQT